MIYASKTENNITSPCDIVSVDNWINIVSPTETEVDTIVNDLGVSRDLLMAALDSEESSRIEIEDSETLILLNASYEQTGDELIMYDTIPIGIILLNNHVITICNEEIDCITNLSKHAGLINTSRKSRLVLQLINNIASFYLRDLGRIGRMTDSIEESLLNKAKNEHILELLSIEKTLVYFSENLSSNKKVLNKILRSRVLKRHEEDEDLIEDAIIEFDQAIEMARINKSIIRSIREAFSAITNNSLNSIMKILASITVILTIPSMLYSFFGMNVPFNAIFTNVYSAVIILLLSLALSILTFIIMKKKNFL